MLIMSIVLGLEVGLFVLAATGSLGTWQGETRRADDYTAVPGRHSDRLPNKRGAA